MAFSFNASYTWGSSTCMQYNHTDVSLFPLGDHDSTVAKLQGFFCTLSQTAQSIGNMLNFMAVVGKCITTKLGF